MGETLLFSTPFLSVNIGLEADVAGEGRDGVQGWPDKRHIDISRLTGAEERIRAQNSGSQPPWGSAVREDFVAGWIRERWGKCGVPREPQGTKASKANLMWLIEALSVSNNEG